MRSLLWKEWREVRMFVLLWPLLAVLMLVGFRTALWIVFEGKDTDTRGSLELVALSVASSLLPVLGALVGGNLFAAEDGSDTIRFLTALPISRRRLWGAKTLTGAAAVLGAAMATAALLLPFVLGDPAWIGAVDFPHSLALIGLESTATSLASSPHLLALSVLGLASASLLTFFTSQWCSAASRRPVNAAISGLLVAGVALGAASLATALIRSLGSIVPDMFLIGTWIFWLFLIFPVTSAVAYTRCGTCNSKRYLGLSISLVVGSYVVLLLLSCLVLPSLRVIGIPNLTADSQWVSDVTPSPDGANCVVDAGGANEDGDFLWFVSIDSQKAQWLDVGCSPTFSPNGQDVVWGSRRGLFGLRRFDQSVSLWMLNTRSGKLREAELPQVKGFNAVLPPYIWSPDSSRLLATRFVSKPIPRWKWITKLFQSPEAWDNFVFSEGSRSAWIVPVHGGKAKPISGLPDSLWLDPFGWSTDGSSAYVTKERQIYRIHVDTCVAEPLGPERHRPSIVFIAADGSRFLWIDKVGQQDAWKVMSEHGTIIKTLPIFGRVGRPFLSPDGNYLAFIRGGTSRGSGAVAVLNVKTLVTVTTYSCEHGTREQRPSRTRRTLCASHIAWSPDSTRIAFNDENDGGRLLVNDVRNRSISMAIAQDAGIIRFIRWLGNEYLLYALQSGGLFMVRTDGTGLRKIFPPREEQK